LSLLVLDELFSFDLFGALGLHLRAKHAKNSCIGFLTGFRRRRKTRHGGRRELEAWPLCVIFTKRRALKWTVALFPSRKKKDGRQFHQLLVVDISTDNQSCHFVL
jgi:hypothetical protein